MTGMNSVTTNSSPDVKPKKVTYVGTMLAAFRYPTAMSVGEVSKFEIKFELDNIRNRYFKFTLKKTSEEAVSVLCGIHVQDWTLKVDSPIEEDSLDADHGFFLRLYISVIGVNEKPKSAVLRSTQKSASVEFKEDSFLNPKVDVDYAFILKCVFRKVETTNLRNEEQEKTWQRYMSKACTSSQQRENMASVLDRPNLYNVLTGRTDKYWNGIITIVSRACFYHKDIIQYFQANENSKSLPTNTSLGKILGYLYTGEKKAITKIECVRLYILSQRFGLKFLKKLCAVYMTEILNNDFVVDVLIISDLTEDSRLFNDAWLFCEKNKMQVFNSDRWQKQACRYLNTGNLTNIDTSGCNAYHRLHTALSAVHGLLLRCCTDSDGYPPSIEDETTRM